MTRICLVEDDRRLQRTLCFCFARKALRLRTLPRGRRRLRAEEHKFDLALIDIAAPDGNGFYGIHEN